MGDILINLFNTLCEIIQEAVVGLLKIIIINSVQSNFTPSLDYLVENLFGGGDTGTLYLGKIKSFFLMAAGTLLVGLLFIHFLRLFFSGFSQTKDSIAGLIGRTALCIGMIFCIYTFGDALLDWGANMLSKASEYSLGEEVQTDDSQLDSYTLLSDMDSTVTIDDSDSLAENDTYMGLSLKDAGVTAMAASWGWLIIALLRIIFFFVVCYNLVKLVLELIQRYMMCMIMYLGLPVAVSFYGSEETELCFFKYLKMFGVEIAVLVLSHVWIDMSMYIMAHTAASFIGMLAMIAFIRIGVSLERFLNEVGLSTASLGGSLLDTTAITGFAMIRAASMGRQAIGNTLANGAALSGNMKLGQAASVMLGRGSSLTAASQIMNNTMGARLANAVNHSQAKGQLARAFASGGLQGNRDAVAIMGNPAISASKKMQYGNQALNSQFASLQGVVGKGNRISATGDYNFQRGLGVQIADMNGNVRTGYLSSTSAPGRGMSIGFLDADGKQCYLNLNNDQTDFSRACNNADGEILLSGNLCTADVAAGISDKDQTMAAHLVNGDMDASHYMYSETKDDGTRDYLYREDNLADWERKGFLGEDGVLYTDGSRDFGDGILTMSDYEGKDLEIKDKFGVEVDVDGTLINQGDLARMEFQAQFADIGERLQCELHDEKGNPTGEHVFFTTTSQGEYFNAGYDASSMTNVHFTEDNTVSATVFKRDGTGTNPDGTQEQVGIHVAKTTATGLIKNAKHVNGKTYGSRSIIEDRKAKGNVRKSAF